MSSQPRRKPLRKNSEAPGSGAFPHRNLPLLLLQARESVLVRFRPVLNTNGITEQQWRIVRAVLEAGPLEPRQIGECCAISSPSLAGILARMDALGFITRERLDHDQRRVRVSLTVRSRTLATRMAPQIEAIYVVIEAQLGKDFTAGCYGALDAMIALLGKARAEAGEG